MGAYFCEHCTRLNALADEDERHARAQTEIEAVRRATQESARA